MPGRLTPGANYALGHETMLATGRRYADRAAEVIGSGRSDFDTVCALSYLSGLTDMAALYAKAAYASSVKDKIAEIDAHIEELLSGGIAE